MFLSVLLFGMIQQIPDEHIVVCPLEYNLSHLLIQKFMIIHLKSFITIELVYFELNFIFLLFKNLIFLQITYFSAVYNYAERTNISISYDEQYLYILRESELIL
ncbi:unnamed protein product [Paramecium sonneborni]|uniref:Uncharacterized protein n=1 Tax=Paramecium sonneborni TaxID=65129 RepID=A0A8S1RE03_9CILI|nr:unnamed protein product [Paramecium sonneborni]